MKLPLREMSTFEIKVEGGDCTDVWCLKLGTGSIGVKGVELGYIGLEE